MLETFSFAGLFGGGGRGARLPAAAGGRLSAPVPAILGGRVLDGVFSYPESGRPDAWALLDAQSGEVMRYSHCAAEDLCEPGHTPQHGSVPLDRPASADPERARGELGQMLEVLRPFLFAEALTPQQEALRGQYRELFLTLTPAGHRPFYRALSPLFFDWVGVPALADGEAGEHGPAAPAPPPTGEEMLRTLLGLFREKIARDEHKERLIDTLHAELQEYRGGLIDGLTRPMEEDVIKLIDDIGKTMDSYRGRPFSRDNYRRLFSLFEGVRTDLTDLLYRHGVEPFTEAGDEVCIGRQKVLSTQPTDDPARDKRVARRLGEGWEKNGRVIRPERVSVYLYAPPDGAGVQADNVEDTSGDE